MKITKINEKLIQIYTVIMYLIAIVVFELGFCNSQFLMNLVNNTGNDVCYNFSLCRIVIYFIFFIVYFIFRKKFVEPAAIVSANRYKRILIYITSVISLFVLAVTIYRGITKPDILRTMSLACLTALMGNIFAIYVSNNSVKNVIVTLATLGILFSVATDFNHILDEKRHFMSAYNVAYFNFDYVKNPITDKKIEQLPQISNYTKIDNFLNKTYTEELTNEVDKEDVASTPSDYAAILYVPAAIGIRVAAILQGSIIDMYLLGRVFNLIIYGILICIALKILPYKKNIFSVIFLLPFILLLSATYSVDGICVGLVSIFIAYCLKMFKENDIIKLKQFLILLGIFAFTLFAKSMGYVAVCLVAFILPLKNTLKYILKKYEKYKKYLPVIIAVLALILIIGAVFAVIFVREKFSFSDPRGVGDINPGEQINYIIHNPKAFVKMGLNHLIGTLLNFNWYANLHPGAYFETNVGNLIFPMILFILYVSLTEDDFNFKLKEKIVLLIAFFAVIITTSLPLYLMYTGVGADHIEGYQTRYILPVIALLLLCISNNKIKCSKGPNRIMNIAIISGVFLLIGLNQLLLV